MWEQIAANKRRSTILLFVLFLMMIAMGCAVGYLLSPPKNDDDQTWVATGVMIGGIVFLIQYAIYALTPQSVVFSGLQVQEVTKEDIPQLINIVEEMTIASGIGKTPRVYLIFDPAPNAFAFGRGEHASVAVTTGLLEMLNRDELQGVIAHEIGHIRNRDINFMTLAAVMLGTIIVLGEVAYRLIYIGARVGERSSSRSSRRSSAGGAELIIFLAALIFMLIAPTLAQILYFASSRRREYLADASAALFTRYPEGLASALEKIAYSPVRLTKVSRAVAPLFIVNPLEALDADSIFSTHPPVEKRIKILRSMAGASLYDYERAAESVLGRRIIRSKNLQATEPQPVMSPLQGAETIGAAAILAASDMHRARGGYRMVSCPTCKLTLKVPPTLQTDTMECPRCGETIHLPPPGAIATASLMEEKPSEAEGEPSETDSGAAKPPFDSESRSAARKSDIPPAQTVELTTPRQGGRWQSLECTVCGQKIQLSPAFSARWISCPKCHSKLIFPADKETVNASA